MKKIISALMISAMALSAMPLMSAPISDKYSNTALAETDNLSSLASFLGADTAYFNFTNYAKNYSNTDMIITDCEDQSYGMSMLQILTHNGVFSVSDIQSGAEKLFDIQFTSEIESIIESYQLTRFNVPQLKLKRTFVKNDTETLVQTAMTSMTAKKYFHISLSMPETLPDGTFYSKASHDVVGIGISDGSWTFNGISYDKCILTLDSNTTSFDENYCIYINTSDNTFCIPAYSDVTLTSVVYDDVVLNYQGKLGEQIQPPVDVTKPTAGYPTVTPENAAEIQIRVNTSKQIGEKYNEEFDEYIPIYEKTDEEYELTAGEYTYDSFYLDLNPTLKIPVSDSYSFKFKNNASQSNQYEINFSAESKDGYAFISSKSSGKSANVSAHKVSVEADDEEYTIAELIPTEPLYKSPYNYFRANAFDAGNFTMTDREDGILLQSYSPYLANMIFGYSDSNSSKLEFRIEPDSGSLLLRYDDETQKIRGFIDKDNDDIYETEIQNGDMNCDGMLDAGDASKILGIYSKLSTQSEAVMKYVNIFADHNGDGMIDATDAAQVLAIYAENSTS